MSAPAKFARFDRKDHFPQGWETCVAQFLELFHRYGYIYKPLSGGSWYSAKEQWKLPDSEILKAIACAHSKFFIGCRAGKTTRFAVLDIDQKSRYHNKQSLEKLLHALSDAGLGQSSLYRSSYSGGWHLYLFFEEPISSADLRKQLVKLLVLNDFQIVKGQLEIFPHPGGQGSLGLGLRLPMQPGFAWLDRKTLEIDHERHELSATKALELFIDVLESDANSYADFRQLKTYVEQLEKRKSAAIARGRGESNSNVVSIRRTEKPVQEGEFDDFVCAVFHRLPPGIIVDNWYKGRLYHLNGLSGPSQRAEAIECVGHYLFYGDPSRDLPALGYGYEQERQWALDEFLRVRNNGQSHDINRGRADAFAQVERAAQWRPPHKKADQPQKYSPVVPITWVRGNAKRQTDARRRISNALEGLKEREGSFTTEELRKAARCSRETIYKHEDIWRAEYDRRRAIAANEYQDLAEGFFASCTGEYNDVVGAASSESKPPSTSLTQDMPSGRLAARRIVYEISMRSKRDQRLALKTSVGSQESSESAWLSEVTRLSEQEPSSLSVPEVKVLLALLATYLATAPSYESQNDLQLYILMLKRQLVTVSNGPLGVVRPP
ncbi:MAG: hypothetical protein K8F91_20420 [Candidatus Obscuribacterales bacterium]|nr:hypothetical protein [Candidatus Obscuribacterales bacterium]